MLVRLVLLVRLVRRLLLWRMGVMLAVRNLAARSGQRRGIRVVGNSHRRRGSHGSRRPGIRRRVGLRMCSARTRVCADGMWCNGVARTGHGTASDDGQILLIVDGGFRVQALLRAHMSQRRIRRRLLQVRCGRMRPGVVADQVQMLAGGCGDAERLLHEPIWLVPIPVGTLVAIVAPIVVTAARALRRLAGSRHGRLRDTTASTLALHFSVRQEAARYATCTP